MLHLYPGKVGFEPDPLLCEAQELDPAIVIRSPLRDQLHPDQLAQRRIQGLLADAQNLEKRIHGSFRISADEIDDAVMNPPQPPMGERPVHAGSECAVSEIEELDGLPEPVLSVLVKHVDTLTHEGVALKGQNY